MLYPPMHISPPTSFISLKTHKTHKMFFFLNGVFLALVPMHFERGNWPEIADERWNIS